MSLCFVVVFCLLMHQIWHLRAHRDLSNKELVTLARKFGFVIDLVVRRARCPSISILTHAPAVRGSDKIHLSLSVVVSPG